MADTIELEIVVDGNDGTGKTTLVNSLRQLGYKVQDRGIPTKMTDDPAVQPREDEYYIILDAPVEVCSVRLLKAGKDLTEKYHNLADLKHYRERFIDVAKNRMTKFRMLLDVSDGSVEVLEQVVNVLTRLEKFAHVHFVRTNE